jgi:uncharacterized damage-inducible protein DinB
MKLTVIMFALSLILPSGVVFAQEQELTGFRAEFIGQVEFVKGRLMSLAEAVPQEKYNWRPDEGVRSVAEVYLHTVGANYYLIGQAGHEVPKDLADKLNPQVWDKMTTNKDEIAKTMERAFTDLTATAKKITEEDLEKTVKVFGTMEMSMRNFMISMLNHHHEHLGQSIAYARSNGIVPPWSQKTKEKEEKPEAKKESH